MLETLQTSTMVTGYGLLASPTTTTVSGIKKVKDEEGNTTAVDVSILKTVVGSVASSATTGSWIGQEKSYQDTLDSVRDAQAYVESMDADQLAELETMLAEKALDFAEEDQTLLSEQNKEAKVFTKK